MKKIRNIYVHIPFCLRKCLYCDFPVYALGRRSNQDLQNSIVKTYLSNLKREIRYTYENIAKPLELDTIYFGGGTPSLL